MAVGYRQSVGIAAVAMGAVLGALVGCSAPSAPSAPPTKTPHPAEVASDLELDRFFSLARVHRLALHVEPQGLLALGERPRQYVAAGLTIDDASFVDVGLRLKGGAGSFVALDGDYPEVSGDGNGMPGKSAMIIDFNRFTRGANLFGLKKLVLNNMAQDPSGLHETVGYALFRAGRVPASRAGYALVSLNGADKGLYALVEPPDNVEFFTRWFDGAAGNLYEGEYGTDLRGEGIEGYDQDHGADRSRQDLRQLSAALDRLGPDDDALAVLDKHLDLAAYLTFAATEIYLGHWDGYAQSANNYFVFHNLADQRWTFLPWGLDQLFEDPMGRYAGVFRQPGPAWGPEGGRVHALCLASVGCRQRLHRAFHDLLDRVDHLGLLGLAARARDLVLPLLLEESTRYGDPDRTHRAVEQVTAFIRERRGAIERWLPCLDGGVIDEDGDGHDGCVNDCDDDDPARFPGAVERCNLVDDDCNGVLDDAEHCPKCFDETTPRGGRYSVCFAAKSWHEARADCATRGQNLASLHHAEDAAHLVRLMGERAGLDRVWIGLSDQQEEGSFGWSDGTPIDLEGWAPGAPNPEGHSQDCVVTGPEGWRDVPCEERHGYLCQ